LSKLVAANNAMVKTEALRMLERMATAGFRSETVMSHFPFNSVVELLRGSDVSLRERALQVLRSLGLGCPSVHKLSHCL